MAVPSTVITKACPECGRPLLQRTNRANGSAFLGCSGYPDVCRHTEAIPESVRLRAMGAPELPLFDTDEDEGTKKAHEKTGKTGINMPIEPYES